MAGANSDIEACFDNAERWQDTMRALRAVALSAGLVEAYKWRQPCYVHQGKNVAIIGQFSDRCSLGFFQGALLTDEANLLVAPGKDSRSSRELRFSSKEQVDAQAETITAYLAEAMANVESGTTVDLSATAELELPAELITKFAEIDGLESAFRALTPGRQRGFVLQIGGAKQSATRSARVDKHVPRILAGKGLHDCICGKSARLPRCDGSHSR